MPPNDAHNRSRSLLRIQRLLNLRGGASPLTLVLDTLEQTARPVLSEFVARAKIGRNKVVFVSFATARRPKDVDVFVKAAGRDVKSLANDLRRQISSSQTAQGVARTGQSKSNPALHQPRPLAHRKANSVIIIDSVNALASSAPQAVAGFLASIATQTTSIVAVYHTDVPIILPKGFNEYEPHPFTLLCHLATAIMRLSNLQQEIGRHNARNRALVEPEWGLKEDREGVLVGMKQRSNGGDAVGVVVDTELRRKSGRSENEKFIIVPPQMNQDGSRATLGKLLLMSEHPIFAGPSEETQDGDGGEEPESTFNLGLTEKQRKDREGIVLPYFDAQTDIGGGKGGRILYEMGREDDFDDEEDEI